MKLLIGISAFILLSSCANSQPTSKENIPKSKVSILCLGDSYTIGESVDASENFPSQLYEMLNQNEQANYAQPIVVAKTGWTTDEMLNGLKKRDIDQTFDYVTLCIGVNDQYRGRKPALFKKAFEKCLLKAIEMSNDHPENVIVLSIPDWGVTPYAEKGGFDTGKVAKEIDQYNAIKKEICEKYKVHYIEITEHYRKKGAQPKGYASDGLHPSPLIYQHWAEKITATILN